MGCQRHATPRACRFSQKQSFKTLAARVIHERNLNAKRFFARAKLPFSFYALFLWQAAAFSSKEKAHGKAKVCHFERSEKSIYLNMDSSPTAQNDKVGQAKKARHKKRAKGTKATPKSKATPRCQSYFITLR